jgi:hypothetical protein
VLGKSVVARQQIVELSSVRVVVRCEWRFTDEPEVPPDDRPFQRWMYTIYPTGQMFVEVEATAALGSDWSPQLGLAVTFASTQTGDVETRVVPGRPPTEASGSSAGTGQALHAVARGRPADSLIMFVPTDLGASARIVEQADSVARRTSFVAVDSSEPSPVKRWTGQILLASAGKVLNDDAAARAKAYTEARAIEVEIGSAVVSEGAAARMDGFDPASGCYVLAPESNRVRLVLDGREHPLFSPAFRIAQSAGREAWVYVNHLIFDVVARDAAGELIFQLPETITDRTIVEVVFRQTPAASG